MVVPDGTMQKEKRLGAEGVGEGVYGIWAAAWTEGMHWADADGWELG